PRFGNRVGRGNQPRPPLTEIARATENAPTTLTGQLLSGGGWEHFAPSRMEFPLAGVTVRIIGETETTLTTNAQGRFTLENAPEGVYDLRVEVEGYLPMQRIVPFYVDGSGGDLTFRLHRDY
ncbi:MAG: carboxypeptidase regulatory-like domain-containing protein, partial [Candidatus Poribacteria bacterium]|nr:carboxypeptidase regulatory-like domain-containing protein [Candidatus Poribacteria bacterium]